MLTQLEAENAFGYKLSAALFFRNKMETVYEPNKEMIIQSAVNRTTTSPDVVMELFRYFDAFMYELSSCFDMVLQLVNVRHNLGFRENQIRWQAPFKQALAAADSTVYTNVENAYQSSWFQELLSIRNHITHRGISGLMLEYNELGELTHIGVPGMSLNLFERCDLWGDNMANIYSKIK